MEEMVDVIDSVTGEKTGKVISKNEAHNLGVWHSAIHILLFNKNKDKVLLQKRCSSKKLYPNMWDITVGGHISAGEEPLVSANRELEEELGLKADDYEFEYVDRIKEEFVNNGVDSKEFVYVYKIVSDVDINDITLQESEVSEAGWFTLDEVEELISNGKIIEHVAEFEVIRKVLGR